MPSRSPSIKYCVAFLALFLIPFISKGQDTQILSLGEAMKMAKQKSLDAFRAKRQYAINYWEFRSYKASLLPKLDLNLEPFTYNRAFVQRYDNDQNIDVYRLQQNLNSFGELSLSQNILATGARVFASSSFNRVINYGDVHYESYSTTPIRIGIYQPIMSFNALKWQKKTANLELEKAEKEYISQEQDINLKTINLFFNWALAKTTLDIAKENLVNSKRLYEIGKKRYDLGSIEKDDLLNLELESFTSVTDMTKAEQELQSAISDLKLFLAVPNVSGYVPELPELIPEVKIDLEEARALAKTNNPELLDITINRINAERDLDKAIKDNRFDLSINASYGLNQQASDIRDAYANFLDQQIVAVQFSMPLLDWGERRGNIKTAKMTKELSEIETKQLENDLNRQLLMAVNNFNLQQSQVIAALKAKTISSESYTITEKRFLSGKVDLLRLLNAREAYQSSTEQYVQSLRDYWRYYYEVQQFTLYDFMNQRKLSADPHEWMQE